MMRSTPAGSVDVKTNTKLPVVYIAGPYRAQTHLAVSENIRAAKLLAIQVWRSGMVAL